MAVVVAMVVSVCFIGIGADYVLKSQCSWGGKDVIPLFVCFLKVSLLPFTKVLAQNDQLKKDSIK